MRWSIVNLRIFFMIILVGIIGYMAWVGSTNTNEGFIVLQTCVKMNDTQKAYAQKTCTTFDSNEDNCRSVVDSIVCPNGPPTIAPQ
jgi:hypothetical protein